MNKAMDLVLAEVRKERERQLSLWGDQDHPDHHPDFRHPEFDGMVLAMHREHYDRFSRENKLAWRHILSEEVAEVYAEDDPAKMRQELIQVAAVAVAWIEAMDRRVKS